MTVAVFDASVSTKLVLHEEFSFHARALVSQCLRQRLPILVPPLIFSEMTNAIYQQQRRRTIETSTAGRAIEAMQALPFRVVAPARLYAEALRFAQRHELTSTYDSVYVALARLVHGELWTNDLELVRTVADDTPEITWIGDFPRREATT